MATGLAIAAMVISILSALSSARTSYQVNGSGFRASHALLTDLATLLAALRSISVKGAMVMGEQRKTPIPIDTELATLRTFLTSTSGLAVSLYAGKIGSVGAPDDPRAGAWRVLRMNFTNLAAMTLTTASDNQVAGVQALEIERTLSALNRKSIKGIRHEIKNLPNVLSSLADSRQHDVLLKALDEVTAKRKTEADFGTERQRLRQLKTSGIDDAELDLWLAMLENDLPAGKDALARGADPNISLGKVLDRYRDVDLD